MIGAFGAKKNLREQQDERLATGSPPMGAGSGIRETAPCR
jgi:hypothetical protein